jgi:hypothetical protein
VTYRESDWWETLMTARVSAWRMVLTVLAVAVVGAVNVRLSPTVAVVVFAFALGGVVGAVIAWRMDHAKRLQLAEYAVNNTQQKRAEIERAVSLRAEDRFRHWQVEYPLDVAVEFVVYASAPDANDAYAYTHVCRSLSELFRVVQDWINAPINYVGVPDRERLRRPVGQIRFDNRTSRTTLP